MARLTKIYTRTGDDGSTALGTGDRIAKTAPRIAAYGTVDELNAAIGVVLTCDLPSDVRAALTRVQNELFHAGADLCVPEADKGGTPGPRIEQRHIAALETLIDSLNASLPPLKNFVLPGGTAASAQLHVARTVARRAERDVVRLADAEPVNPLVVAYLNRLSDALFVMARFENQQAGVAEPLWDSRA